jgi:exosortase H (IPTLxxWG-CTERM-specific)
VVPEQTDSPSPAGWLARNRPAVLFIVMFGFWLGAFSLFLRVDLVDDWLVVPMTELLAWVSHAGLRLVGFETSVAGTIIQGSEGFAVNILKGCNGVYVMAIFVSAILAFPATWKQRLVGILLGVPAVQGINLARIVSLYYIGVRHPALFERFHYHVWQTIVIILSMALWLGWADQTGRVPRRQARDIPT